MLGLVGVLSSSLLAIVLVFVVMLLSYLLAIIAPTSGEYKLEYESGLIFPIDSFIINEQILNDVLSIYQGSQGVHSIDLTTTCSYGVKLDALTAGRYMAYNYVFLFDHKKTFEIFNDVFTVPPKVDIKENKCFLMLGPAGTGKFTIRENDKMQIIKTSTKGAKKNDTN